MGCQVTVTLDDGQITEISGYTCKRGLEYARTEVTAPVRTITTTVRVTGGTGPVVSVKTAEPVPKESIADCMEAVYVLSAPAPLKIGDVVCKNLAGTGVALVATSDMDRTDN